MIPRLRRSPRPCRPLISLALLLAGTASCGTSPPPSPGLDLLARTPDSTNEGVLREKVPSHRLHLADGGEVAYRLALGGPASVRVRGAAGGRGRLVGIRARVDPRHDRTSPPSAAVTLRVDHSGDLAGTFPLPDPEEEIVELRLSWHADEDPTASVTLTELTLVERAPLARIPIVFISVDTLAARHLSLYGYARETSPYLARFAQDAVVFTECRANAPWTIPSYLSQFTGLAPDVFECESRGEEGKPNPAYIFPEERWTMAEMLHAAGYRTAAFIDNPNLTLDPGFRQGFKVFDQRGADAGDDDPEGGMRLLGTNALAWMDGLGTDEPFFLLVQPFDVHGPYLPSAPWKSRFRGDGHGDSEHIAPVATGSGLTLGRIPRYIAAPFRAEAGSGPWMHTSPLVAAYDAEILELDDALRGFMGALEERGVFERAVVVVSADHGESMTAHGALFMHTTHHEDVLRVPLVLRPPGTPSQGRVVNAPVQLVDLYPTFADFAGLHLDLTWQRGRSLVPFLNGASPPPVPVLARGGIFEGRSITLDGWKLIETRPRRRDGLARILGHAGTQELISECAPELLGRVATPEETWSVLEARLGAEVIDREMSARVFRPHLELYHLRDDPDEEHDLARERPRKLAELQGLLEAEKERVALARAEHPLAAPEWTPDPADLERLRELGYGGR